ncbi:MAG: DUF3857 domain-containing protein [Sphingobacteriales bacterium]
MKKYTLSLVIGLLSFQQLYSQERLAENESWANKPMVHSVDSKYSKEPAVVILDKRKIEFRDESNNQLTEYYTVHKIIHINDDRGIESLNKIYLGISENADIVDVKARTILTGGKTIELDKGNIKDLKESDGNTYKIFAVDGLEKGCDMEYLYTVKKPTSFFGREEVQGPFPILETNFQLVAPDRLRFDIKPYNFTVGYTDTVINGKRIAGCIIKETSGADEEKYAFYNANLKRIEYKLSYNDVARKGERLFTWNELGKRLYAMYTAFADKDNTRAADMVQQNGWDKLDGEVSKITAVENYVKTNYSYNEDLRSEEANNLTNVMQKKVAGTIGMMRLYTAIFQNLGVNYQYVLTGNRSKFIIDKSFENWNNCDYPLFYFPAENKFIAPTRPDFRYPWILPVWGATGALFCKKTSIGSLSTAIAEVRKIELEDYTKSFDNIDSHLEFNPALDSLTIDSRQSYGGYIAVDYRNAFNFANDEQKRTIIKELAKAISNSEHILSSEVLNKEFDKGTTNEPLVLHIKTKSGELIEQAGNKILVKIGLAIGPQVEMYQEKPRQEPVDLDYGHVEERKIEFVIPPGYVINNPNDLKIAQTYKENGELTMGFVSDYQIKGDILSVHIMEEYRKTFYPLDQFDQFRKIINASSDFNKVVLVLEKKDKAK